MVAENRTKRTDNPYAFSLAELMVAIGILGIGMLIIAAAFPVALDQTRQAVELQTSQSVFNEAVNTLQTKVDWIELEEYLSHFSSSSTYKLGSNIWIINFDEKWDKDGDGIDDFAFKSIPDSAHLVYSQDDTYGWLTACQKLTDGMYKFWIFIVREPSGIKNSAGTELKTKLSKVTVNSGAGTTMPTLAEAVNKGQYLLADDGEICKVIETTLSSNKVKLNRELGSSVSEVASVKPISGARLTRKAPTVWVYETVINY